MRRRGEICRLYQLSLSTESTQKSCNWPAVDFVGESRDHAAVFKVEEAAARGGKNQYRHARMAKDQQLHLAAEPV